MAPAALLPALCCAPHNSAKTPRRHTHHGEVRHKCAHTHNSGASLEAQIERTTKTTPYTPCCKTTAGCWNTHPGEVSNVSGRSLAQKVHMLPGLFHLPCHHPDQTTILPVPLTSLLSRAALLVYG